MSNLEVAGVRIPDSAMAKQLTQLIRDTESDLLFNHSTRVYFWGALTGGRKGLKFDPELLYAGAMFHDIGLTEKYRADQLRFEVNGANAARDFLTSHSIDQRDVEKVWTAIALHTTPGVPEHMHPEIALVTAGVEMDVLGFAFDEFPDTHRHDVVSHYPRGDHFKEEIIDAFNEGMKFRPFSTFGTVNDDVLALKDPNFERVNFCSIIHNSAWPS